MDTYEIVTILQIQGKEPKILRKVYVDVDYKTNDRDSFVYTRTRRIKVPEYYPPDAEHYSQEVLKRK